MVNLIRQLRPDAHVTATKDGASALELVRSDRPEAVLTDIRMPNMDGLTFLQQLKEEGIKTKVVMVSAYNLFEYAQTAVRHGAYDYLLKPVEVEKIDDVLSRIEHQLVMESMQHVEAEELKHRLELAASAYRNRLILNWLNGSASDQEYEELDTYDWLQGSGFVIFSELRIRQDRYDQLDNAACLRSLEQGWEPLGEAITIPLNTYRQDDFQAITLIRISSITAEIKAGFRSIASALAAEWVMNGQLTHGIGPVCNSLLKEGPLAFRAAQTVNRYHFHDCWKGILFHEELKPSHNPMVVDTEKLYEALQGNDPNIAIEMCRAAFEQLSGGGHTDPSLLKEHASFTLMKVKSRIRNIVDRQVGSLLTDTAMTRIQACRSYEELMLLLELRLREIHDALRQIQLDKSEIIMTKCLDWIQERLKEDLTLERAAEQFFFNPSYFSTLIKSRTGMTFSEHVTAARMKRAKELLAENKLRIYEISTECGYQDTKYFCRVFKKQHGISPESYKHTSLPERKHEE
jgi:two-component system response regulator YesN